MVLIQRGSLFEGEALTQDIGIGLLIFNDQHTMEKLGRKGVLIGCKCLNQSIMVKKNCDIF